MSSEPVDTPDVRAADVETVRIEDEMEQSYIDYAMSVIAGRALPDARDGLKPVHRRILYAMHREGVTSGSGHRKSSSVVGDTMGDYHPHGDSAIYDALARMAQEFSMRYPLVDGQGNFGSVDGDPPAAMRYTEARMAPIAEDLLADIEKDTVDFAPNYDDRLEEPAVLPSAIPNLLVNGSSGIAVGMSTNVPPHNLGEVIDATLHRLHNPASSIADLMEHVEGPDFPTGAKIVGRQGIYDAYTTGRGRIRVRASMEVMEDRIVVSELPYQANKARLIERIADDVNEGQIEGIRDLRDESDRDGIRIVIELKRGATPEVVENQLLERHLETTFGAIMLALVDGQPTVLTLDEAIDVYLDHRREVVRRRSEHDLAEAEERAHLLDGRLVAVEHAEDVVELIRESEDRDAAKAGLQREYDLSERQAEHVVRMQLGSLTSLERQEIADEREAVGAKIERLELILDDPEELRAVIADELRDVRDDYADDRRTTIVEDASQPTEADLIPEEEVVVVLTADDYLKRMPVDTFSPQGRGGKGVIGADLKDGDRVVTAFTANSHDYLLCFTDAGQVYRLRTFDVPEMGRTARGRPAANLLDLDDGESVVAVADADDFDEGFLTLVTRQGYVKRTPVDAFGNIRSTGIIATRLEDGDELVDVATTDGDSDLVIGTAGGLTIRFDEDEVRPMGRTARGVHGVRLVEGDHVAGLAAVEPDHEWLFTVTANGYGKRTAVDEYRTQSRNGKGLVDIDTGDRNGPVVDIAAIAPGDQALLTSENGQIVRIPLDEVSTVGRNTMGVTVMGLAADDRLADADVIPGAALEEPE
jgi:DNA gyrase subunit A